MIGIEIEIAEKTFPAVAGAPSRTIYRDFRLEVAAGEFVALLAPSGAGKTTLLNLVAGLDRDYRGCIRFAGAAGPVAEPRLGYVFQNPRLLPWRTVLENITLPLTPPDAARRARDVLADVGLAEFADSYPERLSVGQQRRVALARAFALEPDLLLMDEPFASLDEATAARLRDLLRALLARHAATVLFVTHDSREALALGSRVVVLEGLPLAIARDVRVTLSPAEREGGAALEALRSQLSR